MDVQIEALRAAATQLKSVLGLSISPVGVRFVFHPEPLTDQAKQLKQHRYCQALMRARHGEKSGAFAAENPSQAPQAATQATCACGSGGPVMRIIVDGQEREVVALPLIFENYKEEGKPAVESTANELLEMVKVYNPILPEAENAYQQVLLREYASFLARGA